MEILKENCEFGVQLGDLARKPFGGFIAGPIVLISGIAQTAINLIALVFSPFTAFFLDSNSKWSGESAATDGYNGISQIISGIIFTLPGSSYFINWLESAIKKGEMN